jgi:signal peptidase I
VAIEAPGAPPETAGPIAAPRRRRRLAGELPLLVLAAVVIALLLKTFVLQAFFIPSTSMYPTLHEGDRVLVEKVVYRFGEPEGGDIVVFERELGSPRGRGRSLGERIADAVRGVFGASSAGRRDFIKRVVAVGGDTIEGHGGAVYVNGGRLPEPYLGDGVRTASFEPRMVPQGEVFVMGDNRTNSNDSRSFGPIPAHEIVGRAFLVIWPPQDFGTL